MIKSKRRVDIDIRLELVEEYIRFLMDKGLSDDEIQRYIDNLNLVLFKGGIE